MVNVSCVVVFMSGAHKGSIGSGSGLNVSETGLQLNVSSERLVEPGIEPVTPRYKASDLSTT